MLRPLNRELPELHEPEHRRSSRRAIRVHDYLLVSLAARGNATDACGQELAGNGKSEGELALNHRVLRLANKYLRNRPFGQMVNFFSCCGSGNVWKGNRYDLPGKGLRRRLSVRRVLASFSDSPSQGKFFSLFSCKRADQPWYSRQSRFPSRRTPARRRCFGTNTAGRQPTKVSPLGAVTLACLFLRASSSFWLNFAILSPFCRLKRPVPT